MKRREPSPPPAPSTRLSADEWRAKLMARAEQGGVGQLTARRNTELSEAFRTYYAQIQALVPAEEWPAFEAALAAELPTSFRIVSLTPYAALVDAVVRSAFAVNSELHVLAIQERTLQVTPPTPLALPGGLCRAWSYPVARSALRLTPALRSLKRFLTYEDEAGHIVSQEYVSMLPPFLLHVESHHRVLDLCAAPGSKTGQLLEALHAGQVGTLPTGFVVANDSDVKRAQLLVHRIQRLGSPCGLVISHLAQDLPFAESFDRILADVPCSGDGTLRKLDHGTTVTPCSFIQHNCLLRMRKGVVASQHSSLSCKGAQLLAIEGRMVYSTCSLNPIENEAVVSALLAKCGGALRLVDVRSELSISTAPGMTQWAVWEPSHGSYGPFDSLRPSERGPVRPTMYPPSIDFHLERCIRIYPHMNDTGGFFIAVLEKVSEVPYHGPQSPAIKGPTETGSGIAPSLEQPAKPSSYWSEAAFVSLTPTLSSAMEKARAHYGLPSSHFADDVLLCREGAETTAKITLVPPALRRLILDPSHAGLKVLHAGVRVFQHDSSANQKHGEHTHMRLTNEGLLFAAADLCRQFVDVGKEDFEALLGAAPALRIDKMHACASVQELLIGPVVVHVQHSVPQEASTLDRIRYGQRRSFVAWRGEVSLRLSVNKIDLRSLQNLFLSDSYAYGESQGLTL